MNILSPIRIFGFVALLLPVLSVSAEELEPIKIELPEASFGGTPIAYFSPNLEEESFKDREPFLAPKGTAILSKGKAVTASAKPQAGELPRITDGDKAFDKTSIVELPEGLQWIQIDLEKSSAVYAVVVWHHHAEKRVYFDFVAQLSDDPEFKTGVTTLYNNDFDNSTSLGEGEDNEYVENNKGRLIDAKGAKGRYLRIYGKGNTHNDFTDFIEVEVWGE